MVRGLLERFVAAISAHLYSSSITVPTKRGMAKRERWHFQEQDIYTQAIHTRVTRRHLFHSYHHHGCTQQRIFRFFTYSSSPARHLVQRILRLLPRHKLRKLAREIRYLLRGKKEHLQQDLCEEGVGMDDCICFGVGFDSTQRRPHHEPTLARRQWVAVGSSHLLMVLVVGC